MPKKKASRNSNQSELPLDATAAPAGRNAESTRSKEEPPAIPPAETSLAPAEVTAPVLPPPPRRGGEKVQDEDSPLATSYRSWFLDYASYVILDRAVPHIDDGLKPVQRRILHTLWEMDVNDPQFQQYAE